MATRSGHQSQHFASDAYHSAAVEVAVSLYILPLTASPETRERLTGGYAGTVGFEPTNLLIQSQAGLPVPPHPNSSGGTTRTHRLPRAKTWRVYQFPYSGMMFYGRSTEI